MNPFEYLNFLMDTLHYGIHYTVYNIMTKFPVINLQQIGIILDIVNEKRMSEFQILDLRLLKIAIVVVALLCQFLLVINITGR